MDLSERIRGRAYEIWIASGIAMVRQINIGSGRRAEILSSLRSAAVAKAPAKWIRGRPD